MYRSLLISFLLFLLTGFGTVSAAPSAELLFELPWAAAPFYLDSGGEGRPVQGPGAVSLGPQGEIWILDGLDDRVQVLSESGHLLRSIRLPGHCDLLAVGADGRLALWRRHLRAVEVLDSDGDHLGSLPVSLHLGTVRSLAITPLGEVEMENAFGERFMLGGPDAPRGLKVVRLDRRHGPAGSLQGCGLRLEEDGRVRLALKEDMAGVERGREGDGQRWTELDLGEGLRSVRFASPCMGKDLLLELEVADGPGTVRRSVVRIENGQVGARLDLASNWLYVPYGRFSCRDQRCVMLHPSTDGLQVWAWGMP